MEIRVKEIKKDRREEKREEIEKGEKDGIEKMKILIECKKRGINEKERRT